MCSAVKLRGPLSISGTDENILEKSPANLKNVGNTSFVPGPFRGKKGHILEKNVINVKNGENIFSSLQMYKKNHTREKS